MDIAASAGKLWFLCSCEWLMASQYVYEVHVASIGILAGCLKYTFFNLNIVSLFLQ